MVFTTTFTFDWPTLKITTMEKMIILTDSGSDLTDAQAQQYGVAVVRNPMVVGGENFIENNTITDEEVMRRMRDGQIVTTSQPTLGSVIETVDALLKTYDKVIYVESVVPRPEPCPVKILPVYGVAFSQSEIGHERKGIPCRQ